MLAAMNLYFAPIETSLMRMLRLLFMLCAMLAVGSARSATIVLEGNYQGKNLYVQNPYAEAGVGFCVYQVTVNDKVATDEINSSAFEVDLGNFNLAMGDKVVIKIMHKDGCTPKVLNPEVLKPKSTFDIVKQGISPDGTYTWTTANESGRLAYVVQQKRWNKWIRVGEVMGEGSPGNHDYSFKVVPHSGENTFRVKQTDLTNRPRFSENVQYTDAKVPVVTWTSDKNAVRFSSATLYEVYDQFGNIVKRGFASEIDVKDLKKGLYYLNYDNKMGESFKK